jgi:hypothetical protein
VPRTEVVGGSRNHFPDSLYVFEHFIIPKAKYRNPVKAQQPRASQIGSSMTSDVMLSSVNLDGKPNSRTTMEIDDIPADRMLPAKTQSVELAALRHIPEFSFSSRCVTAQAAGASRSLFGP